MEEIHMSKKIPIITIGFILAIVGCSCSNSNHEVATESATSSVETASQQTVPISEYYYYRNSSTTDYKNEAPDETTSEIDTEPKTEFKTEPATEIEPIYNPSNTNNLKASGTGDYVAEGLEVNEYGILNISHNGSRNFCVWIYDQNDRKDLLVNTIGNYNGAVLVNGTGSYTLEIKADGNWSIESQSLSVTDDTTFSGTGDCVTAIVDNAKGSWEISNNGSRNFVVWSHDVFTNDKDLLVNEIGNYTGTVLVKHPNETIFEITSDGNWSIDKR